MKFIFNKKSAGFSLCLMYITAGLFTGTLKASYPFIDNHNIKFLATYGYVSDGNKMFDPLINDYLRGFDVRISNYVNGEQTWHTYLPNSETGWALKYVNTSNAPVLGQLFSLSRYVDFNIIQKKHLSMNFTTGLGSAFTNKIYNPVENPQNIFFSRHLNFYFSFDLFLEYKLPGSQFYYLNSGLRLWHASNGESRLPNGGLSASSIYAGIIKKGGRPTKITQSEHTGKKWHVTLDPAFGYKEYWRWGSKRFKELAFSSDVIYDLNKVQLIGLGAGVFYDETRKSYSNHNLNPVHKNVDAMLTGIHVVHQLNLDPLYIILKMGLYTSNIEVAPKRQYNLLGIRYKVGKNVYLSMLHRSHGAFYGYNIYWGVGFEL